MAESTIEIQPPDPTRESSEVSVLLDLPTGPSASFEAATVRPGLGVVDPCPETIYDLQRLMVERVKAAGFVVRRVVWSPGESLSIAFFVSDNHTAWIEIDDEHGELLTSDRKALVGLLNRHISLASNREAVA